MNESQRESAQFRIPANQAEGMPDLDFLRNLETSATPCLALWADLSIAAVSDSYLAATGRTREAIVGFKLFEILPSEPSELLYILYQVEDVMEAARGQMAHQERERVSTELLVRTAEVEALRQAEALKDQFLGILSHELRTPINAIMGFGSILDDELSGALNADQHTYVERIMAGADMMLALVNDLLDMSRMQAGKFSLNPNDFALVPVIENVIANLTPAIDRKGQQLVAHLQGNLPVLYATSSGLRRSFLTC